MGFAAPYGLLALGALGVLLWLYRHELRQRALEVPSLFLWETVPEDPPRGRLRVEPLLLLQLALLALVALAIARPYRAARAAPAVLGRSALVFDTSASMQTLERGESRFEQARRVARGGLEGLGGEVMVIAAGQRARVVVPATSDPARLRQALIDLEPDDGPARLSEGVQLARAAGARTIEVFTDLPREEIGVPLVAGERLRSFRFGETDDNVALAALRVRQTPFQGAEEATGFAVVKNGSRRVKDLALHLTLEGRALLDQPLRLEPRESRSIPLPPLPGPGRLEARITVVDALAVDNRALAYVRPARKLRLLAATASADLASDLSAVAAAIPSLELRVVAPSALQAIDLANADLALFHAFAPTHPPPLPSLYLYPPPDAPSFPSSGEVVAARILDWDERDPVLQDLRYLDALTLERAHHIALPTWAHSLIESRAGAESFPLAFAGELEGRRRVVFAFDFAGRSLRRSENLSLLLLTLNAIRWLAPPDPALPIQVDVGERFRETFPTPTSVRVIAPGGATTDLGPTREAAVEIDRVGEYRVRVGGQERIVYANLFDASESDVGRIGMPVGESDEGATAPATDTATTGRAQALERMIAALALLLLLVEWMYAYSGRRNRELA